MNCLPLTIALTALCAAAAADTHADVLDTYLFDEVERYGDRLHARLPSPGRARWLEDPELRVTPEVDENDNFIQSYSVRFKPTSKRERHARHEIEKAERNLTILEWRQSLAKLLRNRYHQVIELADEEFNLRLQEQHLALDRAILESEQSLANDPSYNFTRLTNALLRTELREADYDSLAQAVEHLRGPVLKQHLVPSAKEKPALSSHLLNPVELSSGLQLLQGIPLSETAEGRIAQLNVRQAKEQLALEKSQSGFGLELFEVGYENRTTNQYNMTIGIRLPFARSSYASGRRLRDLIQAEENEFLQKEIVEQALEEHLAAIRSHLYRFEAHDGAIGELDGRYATLADDADVPILRRHELELLEKRGRAHSAALHEYVELLATMGVLVQKPHKNWLTGI